jgi:hypothetical protein
VQAEEGDGVRPVRCGASNLVYRGPAPGIGDLWCQRVKPHEIRVVYEFDDAEREAIAAGGRVELAMYYEPIPPISMVVLPEEMCRPVGEHGWRGQSTDDVPDRLPEDFAA